MYEVEISDSAKGELRAIFNYIYLTYGTSVGAKRAISRIEKKVYSLRAFPRFRTYKFDKRFYITNVNNYVILYKVIEETKTVIISHIVYSKRQLKALWDS